MYKIINYCFLPTLYITNTSLFSHISYNPLHFSKMTSCKPTKVNRNVEINVKTELTRAGNTITHKTLISN